MTQLPDSMTLGEARAWLRERVDGGEHCPCCTQYTRVYKRKINSAMARALLVLAQAPDKRGFFSLSRLAPWTHESAQLSWWGLIEEEPALRPDGGRKGYWRITEYGERFARNAIDIPMYAHIYDGRLMGHSGERITIEDALGEKFNYAELMAG